MTTPVNLTEKQQEIYVSIWSKAIETQMHFNEMSVKSRQFGLAFVAAALGLGIVLMRNQEDFSIPVPYPFGGFDLHLTVVIAFASATALYAVKLLDLNVYHKMLRGAVTFNEDFERNYMKDIFALDKGMTEAISHFSRFEDAAIELSDDGKRYRYIGKVKKNALTKITLFYRFSIGMLVVVGVVLFFSTAHFGDPRGGIKKPQGSIEQTDKKPKEAGRMPQTPTAAPPSPSIAPPPSPQTKASE